MLHGRETKEDCTRDQLTQIGDCRKKGKINQKRQTKEWEAIGLIIIDSKFETRAAVLYFNIVKKLRQFTLHFII